MMGQNRQNLIHKFIKLILILKILFFYNNYMLLFLKTTQAYKNFLNFFKNAFKNKNFFYIRGFFKNINT